MATALAVAYPHLRLQGGVTVVNNQTSSSTSPVAAKSIKWSNFRSFQSAQLDLARVTVLIGSNNSGKSSLHRPLELMKQTLEIEASLPGLHARGPLVDCGTFQDCSYLGSGRPMKFKINLGNSVSLVRESDSSEIAIGAVEFEFGEGHALNPFVLTGYRVWNDQGTRLLERRMMSEGYDCHGMIRKGNPPRSRLDREVRAQIDLDQPEHFLFQGNHLIQGAYTAMDAFRDDTPPADLALSQFSLKYLALTNALASWARAYFAKLSYIGPARALPQRSYRLGAMYGESGSAGQEIPEILFRILSGEEGFYPGGTDAFETKLAGYLKLVGLRGRLSTSEVAADAFSLYVDEASGAHVNLADSAFGYSQVLPLIVRILLSVPGDTLVVEQPEIHLNPALQGAMADVFVRGVSSGSTAIIETHSEHFLNRLRFLVADGQLDPGDLAVYFVDRGPKQSRVRRIEVDHRGSLGEAWPSGFFGDSLRLARQLNQAQRKLAGS